MNNLLTIKCCNTCMGSADRIMVAAGIYRELKQQPAVVAVVSAMSGVTDLLLNTLRHAEGGDESGIAADIDRLTSRDLEACRELLDDTRCQPTTSGIHALIGDFQRITNGVLMLGERPPRSVDEAIAIGERMSALMMSEYLQASGVAAEAINGASVIVTDAVFGNATPIMPETRKKAD